MSRQLEDKLQTGRKYLPCQSQHHQENINREKTEEKKSKNSVLLVCDIVKQMSLDIPSNIFWVPEFKWKDR